jgi:hypothetical protein
VTTHVDMPEAAAADKPTVRLGAKHPEPIAVPVSMPQVVAEELLGLLIGKEATECGHDSGILVHPAQLVQILDTQAFSDQAVCAKGHDCFHTCSALKG